MLEGLQEAHTFDSELSPLLPMAPVLTHPPLGPPPSHSHPAVQPPSRPYVAFGEWSTSGVSTVKSVLCEDLPLTLLFLCLRKSLSNDGPGTLPRVEWFGGCNT